MNIKLNKLKDLKKNEIIFKSRTVLKQTTFFLHSKFLAYYFVLFTFDLLKEHKSNFFKLKDYLEDDRI